MDIAYRGLTHTEGINETLKDAKKFAMSFDNGEGLAVCPPFQVNREGWRRAQLKEGRLDIGALAQHNAAKKEADIITYSFYDMEEAAINEPKVGMMKSRWSVLPRDPVAMFVDADSRRIMDMTGGLSIVDTAPTGVDQGQIEEEVVL